MKYQLDGIPYIDAQKVSFESALRQFHESAQSN
jgi:hypothetical protein